MNEQPRPKTPANKLNTGFDRRGDRRNRARAKKLVRRALPRYKTVNGQVYVPVPR